jgi:Xaa-Pro aminopeptidase
MLDRIEKLQLWVEEKEVGCLIVDNPLDIFYVCGVQVSSGRLLVYPREAELFVDGRYFEMCKEGSGVPVSLLENDNHLRHILDHTPMVHSIAFDSVYTAYSSYDKIVGYIREQGKKDVVMLPYEAPLQDIRVIKDEGEIQKLRDAADLGNKGFEYGCSLLQEGVTEAEIAREVEIFWKREGGEKPAFDLNISFGSHSSMPHHKPGSRQLRKGDIVLMDIGVTLDKYNSDLTRVVFFGEPDPVLEAIYSVVKKAQEAALLRCVSGVTAGELDAAARDVIENCGYGAYFTHSLGHGIGLEVHEYPYLKNKAPHSDVVISPGMAFTIEPGIYLPGKGGVRIEDTVILLHEGALNLSTPSKDMLVIP